MKRIGPYDAGSGSVPYGDTPFADWENSNPGAGAEGSIPPFQAWTHPADEIVHLIEQSGQTPSESDFTQLFQAVRAFKDIYYCTDDSAAADTVLLSVVSKGAPTALRNGLVVVWKNTIANTAAPTLKLGSLPARALTIDHAAMVGGELTVNGMALAVYDSTADVFRMPAWATLLTPEPSPSAPPRAPNLPQLVAIADGTQSVPNATETAIAFQTTERNNFSASTWDGTSFTVGTGDAGLYSIVGGARFNGTGTGLSTRIHKNGATIAQMVVGGTSGANHGQTLPAMTRLAEGDVVKLLASQSTGGAQNAVATETFMTITKVSV